MYRFISVVPIDRAQRRIVYHLCNKGHKLLFDVHFVSEEVWLVLQFCYVSQEFDLKETINKVTGIHQEKRS